MKKKQKKKKVFVGVSGGVDSSVGLALLKDQGYDVVGVFIRTWQPDWIECTWQSERRDAMRVCAHLDVPFVELDLEKEYKNGVADYMIREYRLGRTPNPDVMCNREVKFGGFLRWALAHGADYVATGHYVDRSVDQDTGLVHMLRGNDPQKDQSYFLWTLEQDQLKHILFPVGGMPKSQVRVLAKKYKLPTATKKDSQGICFIGEIDMKEFLRHYIDEQPGDVLAVGGEKIGTHNGALFFTTGERKGFRIDPKSKGVNDRPYYVIAKNTDDNTITVSQDPIMDTTRTRTVELVNCIDNTQSLRAGDQIEVQVRYRGEKKKVIIRDIDSSRGSVVIELEEVDATLASGQSVVFYRGTHCLGGGIIEK